MIEFKLNKYKFHSVSVVSQFGFWRQREVVGANVEQSYISLKLKPKVTLFKDSMAQGVFQSMAIFPCVLPSARHFGDYQDATAMQ